MQRTEVGLYAPTFRNIQNTVTRVISRFEIQVGYSKLKYNERKQVDLMYHSTVQNIQEPLTDFHGDEDFFFEKKSSKWPTQKN